MKDEELLDKLSEMIDTKLHPVQSLLENEVVPRIDSMQNKLDNEVVPRIDSMQNKLDNEVVPRISFVEDKLDNKVMPTIQSIQILIEHDMMPRLQNIESCYTSTYERYSKGIDQLDDMQVDIDILKSVVAEHSVRLKELA